MYSVTNVQSFEHIAEWYENIKEMNDKMPKMILIGTKIDIVTERQISYKEGQELAEKYDMKFLEVSCLDSDNVQSIIYYILDVNGSSLNNMRKMSADRSDIPIINPEVLDSLE